MTDFRQYLASPATAERPSAGELDALAARYEWFAPVRRLSSDDIIDRFLQEDDLRIVAADGEPEEEVRTAAELDDDDEIVSEELAEIYLAQGLCDKAIAIYRKLSLLNPEKSVYFAELIGKLENNN